MSNPATVSLPVEPTIEHLSAMAASAGSFEGAALQSLWDCLPYKDEDKAMAVVVAVYKALVQLAQQQAQPAAATTQPEQPAVDEDAARWQRLGKYVEQVARGSGFVPDGGEGPFQYIQRISYRTGWEDGRLEGRGDVHRDGWAGIPPEVIVMLAGATAIKVPEFRTVATCPTSQEARGWNACRAEMLAINGITPNLPFYLAADGKLSEHLVDWLAKAPHDLLVACGQGDWRDMKRVASGFPAPQVHDWLQANRKDVWCELLCHFNEVTLKEDPNLTSEHRVPRWMWCCGTQSASTGRFETKLAAAKNAKAVLHLAMPY